MFVHVYKNSHLALHLVLVAVSEFKRVKNQIYLYYFFNQNAIVLSMYLHT